MSKKEEFKKLLLDTNRAGMKDLLSHMEKHGFYTAPCSGKYHLAEEGGLLTHSMNVYKVAAKIATALNYAVDDSLTIATLLHDLGKMGDYGKPNYVENILKTGRSGAQPYKTNEDLLYIPHEIRSIAIAERYIKLTEQEEFAIVYHNGLYADLKYSIKDKETPLYMILHFADLWCSREVEK